MDGLGKIREVSDMEQHNMQNSSYLRILREELVPAFGCTEPIAVALCAARCGAVLNVPVEALEVSVSGNMIKNAKSVVVPNTGGMRGIAAAAAAGLAAGDWERGLEVLTHMDDARRAALQALLDSIPIQVCLLESQELLDIRITARGGGHTACVRIAGHHNHFVLVERDGQVLEDAQDTLGRPEVRQAGREQLTVAGILDFAETVKLDQLRPILEPQIRCNLAIAEEGIRGDYGANVGKVLLAGGDTLDSRMKAYAAAASDARMSGCELPVVINSGSGNQGITLAVPIAIAAREGGYSEERTLRALAIANLLAIHVKVGLGCLSAYCGASSAGCAAACGIAYLEGGGIEEIAHTLVNGLATISGMICDGAKPSCAAKIAMGLEAGLLGYRMFKRDQQFLGGDGIVAKGVEKTIQNIGRLGSEGMRTTDAVVLSIMSGPSEAVSADSSLAV